MKNIYKVIVFSFLFVWTQSAVAQISLVSSTPGDGDVNVHPDSALVLQFSAPLDTTADFNEDFFLGIELFPQDTTEVEPGIELSEDSTTVTITGVGLREHTRYIVLLWAARSINGDSLDHPYVITFSTGDALPTGSISGEITFSGGDAAGSLVAFFENLFDGDPVAVTFANSPYTANFIPDGDFFAVSVKDANGDGEPEFYAGDAVGVYDADGDGLPDLVHVAGGANVPGVDIELATEIARTAKIDLPELSAAAQTWASDAALVGVFSERIEPDGTSFGWFYMYYSVVLADFQIFSNLGAVTIQQTLHEEQPPELTAIDIDWIDSDSVMTVATNNGLTEFMAEHPEAEGHAALHGNFFGHPPDSNLTIKEKRFGFGLQLPKSNKLFKTSGEDVRFFWFVSFYPGDVFDDEFHDEFNWQHDSFEIGIDAETGEVVFGGKPLTAQEALVPAETAAKDWAADAKLVRLGTHSFDEDGRSDRWHFDFYAGSKGEFYEVNTGAGSVTDTFAFPADQYSDTSGIVIDWIDSDSAAAIARENGLTEFLNEYPEAFGNAMLQRLFGFGDVFPHPGPPPPNPGPEHPMLNKTGAQKQSFEQFNDGFGPVVWSISFHSEFTEFGYDRFEMVIDAETGAIILGKPSATARDVLGIADSLALEWAPDANLMTLFGAPVSPEGLADLWHFHYFSSDRDSSVVFAVNSEIFFEVVEGATGMTPNMGGVSETWIDSDSALTVAHENGLGDFLMAYPNARGSALLFTIVDYLSTNSPSDNALKKLTTAIKSGTIDSTITLWVISYFSMFDHDNFHIVMNADTGEPLFVGSGFITAGEAAGPAGAFAEQWASDAELLAADAFFVTPEGRSDFWAFHYYSANKDSLLRVGVSFGLVVEVFTDPADMLPAPPPGIQFDWIDSDSAATIAREHGLAGFLEGNPGAFGWASLHPNFGQPGEGFPNNNAINRPIIRSWAVENQQDTFIWTFRFIGDFEAEGFYIEINAETGEIVFIGNPTTAREAFEIALPFATDWSANAELVCAQAYHIDPDGRSGKWMCRFYSSEFDNVFNVEVDLGIVFNMYDEPPDFVPSTEGLPEDWKDSQEVAVIADANSDSFRDDHDQPMVMAKLSRGLLHEDATAAVWSFVYHAYTEFGVDSLHLFIDAVTGELVVGVENRPQDILPRTFALEQNYPNPFNPETIIKYQLPNQGEVKLSVFNILGQKLITLVNDRQAGGYYKVTWNGIDGAGIRMPSGVYFYRLETDSFVRTRKMLLIY